MSIQFLSSHEWLTTGEDGAKVGISDYAQAQIGDVVYVELPEVGQELVAGEECATVESVKAVFSIYSPVSGVVTSVNTELLDNPEKINEEPFLSWFFTASVSAYSDQLLSQADYDALCHQ